MYNDLQSILEKAIKNYSGKNPKITFIEEDYQVDKKKGAVRCFLRCEMPNTLFSEREFHTFIGIAQVCDKDTFDEKIGKKIARVKAESKAYKAYERQFVKLLESIINYIVIINKEMKKGKENFLESIYYLDKYKED